MRTTVTLTPEAAALIQKAMRERGLSFKEAVNGAILQGFASPASGEPFSTPSFDLGAARVPVEHALRLAGELEDEELLRKRVLRK